MKNSKARRIKAKIKRDLKNFMKDESGVMSKENILKVGMGTIAALTMFAGTAKGQAPACNGQVVHTSDNTVQWEGETDGFKRLIPSHTHHAAHCSY